MPSLPRYLFILIVSLVLASCDNHTSTSSGNGQDISLGNGQDISLGKTTVSASTAEDGMIYVTHSGSGTSADPLVVLVNIRDASNNPIPGTVHWQDNTDDRVYNGTILTHVYESDGGYTMAVVPDGGEKVVITPGGSTFNVVSQVSSSSSGSSSAVVSPFAGFTCSPLESAGININGSGTLTMPNPLTPSSLTSVAATADLAYCDFTFSGSSTPAPGSSNVAIARSTAPFNCSTGKSVSITITANDGSGTANCTWTVN